MRRKNVSSLISPISSRTPSAETALVCERTPKASVHYGAHERLSVEIQESRSLQLWTCFLAFCQKAPALTSKRILNQSSIHRLFKKRPFDQNGFRGALLVSSSGDRRAIGVKTHIRLVRASADARHYEGVSPELRN